MGLTREGYIPESYNAIKGRIEGKLKILSPGLDLSVESPDGQLVDIFAFELSTAFNELSTIHNSYDPTISSGQGLRNLGLITGVQYGTATRSQVYVALGGVQGTVIPAGSEIADTEGNVFKTQLRATVPSTVQCIADSTGPIAVPIGAVQTVRTPITGWTSATQSQVGDTGKVAMTETEFRNFRNKTVLRNFTAVPEVIQARLAEQGIEQTLITNNTSSTLTAPDGTPPFNVHVTIGEVNGVSDTDIALTILNTMSVGTSTYGATQIVVKDNQGVDQVINFTKAVALPIYIDIDVTFLDPNYAGSTDGIKKDMAEHINNLVAGEDVIWSRLFEYITPYSKAQVNTLFIDKTTTPLISSNITVQTTEFATISVADININITV